jgi:hypothetical protein
MRPTENARSAAPVAEDSLRLGYETRDVKLKAILALGVSIVVLVVGSAIGLDVLLDVYEVEATSRDETPPPLEDNESPPAPLLQAYPNRDYAEFREKQERELNSYGWVDREQEVVRIPIERAIDLSLERGLFEQAPVEEEQE